MQYQIEQFITGEFNLNKLAFLQNLAQKLYANQQQQRTYANSQLTQIIKKSVIFKNIIFIMNNCKSFKTIFICLVSFEKKLNELFYYIQNVDKQNMTNYFLNLLLQSSLQKVILNKIKSIIVTIFCLSNQQITNYFQQLYKQAHNSPLFCQHAIDIFKNLGEQVLVTQKLSLKNEIRKNIQLIINLFILILSQNQKISPILVQKSLDGIFIYSQILEQEYLKQLKILDNILLSMFQKNKFRGRILNYYSQLINRAKSVQSVNYINIIINQVLKNIDKICPLNKQISLAQQRKKIQILSAPQVKSFDFFFNNIAFFITKIINKYLINYLEQNHHAKLLQICFDYFLMVSQLNTTQTNKITISTLYFIIFNIKNKPNFIDKLSNYLRKLRQLFIAKMPLPPQLRKSINQFSQNISNIEQIPQGMYQEMEMIYQTFCTWNYLQLKNLLIECLQRQIDIPKIDNKMVCGVSNTIIAIKPVLNQEQQKDLFLFLTKYMINLSQLKEQKQVIVLSLINILPTYKNYIITNKLLCENIPFVLLRIAPLSFHVIKLLKDIIIYFINYQQWIKCSNQLNPLNSYQLWNIFWKIYHQALQKSRFKQIRKHFYLSWQNWCHELELNKLESDLTKFSLTSLVDIENFFERIWYKIQECFNDNKTVDQRLVQYKYQKQR